MAESAYGIPMTPRTHGRAMTAAEVELEKAKANAAVKAAALAAARAAINAELADRVNDSNGFVDTCAELWKAKAARLEAGEEAGEDRVMLFDDDPSYSAKEVALMMRVLDAATEEAAPLRAPRRSVVDEAMCAPASGERKPYQVGLELGAGCGRITPAIAAKVGKLTTIEFIPEFSARSVARCASMGVNNVTHLTADARDTANLPASIDLAFLKWILMFLSDDDATSLLTTIVERLTPGGVLFLIESCSPPDADASLYVSEADHLVAHYRPVAWYKKHLEMLGCGTIALTMVLDDIIYKEHSKRTGDDNVQPIFCFIKGGVSEPPAPAAQAEPPAPAARAEPPASAAWAGFSTPSIN